MKSKLILLAFLFVSVLGLNAQQAANGGFENWTTGLQPDGWATVDGLFGMDAGHTYKDSVDKFQGNASVAIKGDSLALVPQAGVVPGILSLGTATYVPGNPPIYMGQPFTFRPDTVFFAYKFTSPGADTAFAQFYLSKAHAAVLNVAVDLPISANWFYGALVLTGDYNNGNTPDSLLIQFFTSAGAPIKGSVLHVDAMRFGYVAPSSVVEAELQPEVKVFPNPTADVLNITVADNSKAYRTEIYDVTGHLITNPVLNNGTIAINVSNLPSGFYFYKLINSDNALASQGKFEIAR